MASNNLEAKKLDIALSNITALLRRASDKNSKEKVKFLDRLYEAFEEASLADEQSLQEYLAEKGINPDALVSEGLNLIKQLPNQQKPVQANITRCNTCTRWYRICNKRDENGYHIDYGICGLSYEEEEPDVDLPFLIVESDSPYVEARLIVREDFGCILYKSVNSGEGSKGE